MLFSFCCVALRSSFGNSIQQFLSRLVALFVLINLCSCKEKSEAVNNNEPSNDSTIFFPVQDFFYSQIKNVDSIRPVIYMLKQINGQRDSLTITTSQFNELSKPFLENDISNVEVKKFYQQNIFLDNTTNSYTFSYSTQNKSLPIQSLDVLLDTTTQQVKRIFITRITARSDSTVTEKMGWKTDNSFFINRIIELPGNKETIEQISVIWKK